jgi:arylsulfatase A-like enzyme
MNVVVVATHGLNCHWLGPYGNAWVSTPALDALACEAVVFDHHFADEPSVHGFRHSCPAPLLVKLHEAGVTTVFVDDRKHRTSIDREWNVIVPTDPARHATPAHALAASIRESLDRVAEKSRWLLWIETERLLPPWDFEFESYQHYASTYGGFAEDEESSPAESEEVEPTDEPITGPLDVEDDREWHRLHNSFAAAVTSFDSELESIFSLLRERGLDEAAALIVTSGFGWPLGEHGIVGPTGSRMHEELIHLPLLLRLPGHRQGMRRVPAPTVSSDLAPTICDLIGVDVPFGITRTSLLPLTASPVSDWRDLVRSLVGVERAIRSTEWAFLPPNLDANLPARLYRKPDDMWEANDIAQRHPDECDRLAALIDAPTDKEPTP